MYSIAKKGVRSRWDRGTTCAGMAQIAPWDLADGGACLIRLVWPSAGYADHAGYAWPSAGQVGINVPCQDSLKIPHS